LSFPLNSAHTFHRFASQDEVEGPRTKKQLQEERRRRMKLKEVANLESTLEACGSYVLVYVFYWSLK